MGGIGAVLEGLLTSKTYLAKANRNILVGPFWPSDDRGESRLGASSEVLYSSLDNIFRSPLTQRFREIEQAFDVGIVYGRRKFIDKATGVISTPEVLLIDVARYDAEKLGVFKFRLWKTFGVESAKYDQIWDYEQWVRLAEPAIKALHALGAGNEIEPCVILSHEYMGMPTVLAAIMEGEHSPFRTIFYAHEVAPMRRIVEHSPGHDTMFYNVLSSAMSQGHFVEDVFGDQSDYYKSSLVKAARFCDGIFCVGDYVLKEIRFLGPDFVSVDAQLAYNGVPCWKISVQEKMESRNRLQTYCKNLLGFAPDYVFSHVTRLVPSKGLWRDLRVLEHLERHLRARNETAVLFTLSTEVPARRSDDIRPGASLSLAGRASRRLARSIQWRGRVLPGCSGISRSQPQHQGRLHQSIWLRSKNLRRPDAGGHGIHGHPQRLRRRIRPEHLRAVRHCAGRADQLRRHLRLQQRLRLRRIRRQSQRRQADAERDRRRLHRAIEQGPSPRAAHEYRPRAAR
jgi:hypothetical protein